MAKTPLARAIEAARERMGLNRTEYAALVGLTVQGLARLTDEGGAPSGRTLARLAKEGGVDVTPKLVASFRNAAA